MVFLSPQHLSKSRMKSFTVCSSGISFPPSVSNVTLWFQVRITFTVTSVPFLIEIFLFSQKHRDFHLSTVRRLVSLCRYVASADPDIFRISAIILWPAGRTDARAAGSDVHTLSHLPALPSPHMNKDFYRSFRPSSPLILSPWFILTINSFLEIQEVLIVMSTFLNIATPAFLW